VVAWSVRQIILDLLPSQSRFRLEREKKAENGCARMTTGFFIKAIGGVQAKKRVAPSHLIFNVITGIITFLNIPLLVWIINIFIDVKTNSLTGLALFHTLFNVLGVVIFFPFVGLLSRLLVKFYPDYKPILTVYIDKTPSEVSEAATAALRKEICHLLQECQL
jgi:phosphate:Na+ symporter